MTREIDFLYFLKNIYYFWRHDVVNTNKTSVGEIILKSISFKFFLKKKYIFKKIGFISG